MQKILEVKNLEKVYDGKIPFQALNHISFQMEKGEFTAVMGPSGSGKSTLLNVISTIDKPTGGKVLIDGKEPHKMDDDGISHFRRTSLGFVFQDFNLVSTLTVAENLMLPLTLEGVPVREMHKKVKKVASFLAIDKILSKRTFEISGGQAQRCAIGRAVIQNPSLILADEPTGNLDSKSAKDVMNLFRELNNRLNATILMVTHDAYVASFCSRILIIKDGELYEELYSDGNQTAFYQKIQDTMTFLGGGERDIVSNGL